MKKKLNKAIVATVAIIVLAFVIFILQKSVEVAKPGERKVLISFGKIYQKTFKDGIVWKVPFMKDYGCDIFTIDIRPKRYEYTYENIKLKNLQSITIKSAYRVQLNDSLLHVMYDKYSLGYVEYEELVIRDLILASLRANCGLLDIWNFVGTELSMVSEAVMHIVNDQLKFYNFAHLESYNILNDYASKEFNRIVEETAQTQQMILLETQKIELARKATQKVQEEAYQAFAFLENEAKLKGKTLELTTKALTNPLILQYELMQAVKIHGLPMPKNLTTMNGEGLTPFTFMNLKK